MIKLKKDFNFFFAYTKIKENYNIFFQPFDYLLFLQELCRRTYIYIEKELVISFKMLDIIIFLIIKCEINCI